MDPRRHFPTFSGLYQLLRHSPGWRSLPLIVARDAWTGTQRRCVVEIGRGVRRVSLWESASGTSSCHPPVARAITSITSLVDGLADDIRSVGAGGLRCHVVLQPPWAVAKVFPLSEQEILDPPRWIAEHRTLVFPAGIEDDVTLTIQVERYPDAQPRLIIGLARRSIVQSITACLREIGSPIGDVVFGPLWVLQTSRLNPLPNFGLLLDRSGSGSCGCWLFVGGSVTGWTEVVEPEAGELLGPRQQEILHAYFSDLVPEITSRPEVSEAACYRPIAADTRTSRWRFPKSALEGSPHGFLPPRQVLVSERLQQWSSWAFRWSVVVLSVLLFIIVATRILDVAIGSAYGSPMEEQAELNERHAQLLAERDRLAARVADVPDQLTAYLRPALFWLNLGQAKVPSIWLRSVKLQPTEGQTAGWLVDGLALDREGPYMFARNLARQSQWHTQVVKLEVIDASRTKAMPAELKGHAFHFAVEVTP